MTSGGVFLLLIEIISIAKLLSILHFFILKHEKQTLSYIHTKFEGNKNNSFFLVFLPAQKIIRAWQVDAPENTWYE